MKLAGSFATQCLLGAGSYAAAIGIAGIRLGPRGVFSDPYGHGPDADEVARICRPLATAGFALIGAGLLKANR
jgi:hypothetical protein